MGKILLNFLIVVCLGVFAVCAYQLIDYFYGNMQADKAFDKQRVMVEDTSDYEKRLPKYEQMQADNQDFEGWITVDGTNINNPMVQTVEDPEYYLYRNFEGQYSKPGTIFLSNVADLYKPTDVITVFGHNMKDGTMFGSLRRFEEKEFLKEHNRMWIDSLENRREFEVVRVMRIRVDVENQKDVFPYYQYSDFKNKKDFNKFIEQCDTHSIYNTGKTVKYGDKFVVLSTCEYSYNDGSGRLVVMAKEVEPEMKTDIATAQITKPMMGKYVMIGIGVAAVMIILVFIVSLVRSARRRRARNSKSNNI
jgi:sortase B